MAAGMRVFYSAVAATFVPFLHPDPVTIRTNQLTESLPSPHGLYYALLGIWERFDTLWFLRIAERGYDRPMAPIFYPLYPAAIRGMSVVLPAVAAALVVSTVAAFFAFWGAAPARGRVIGNVIERRKAPHDFARRNMARELCSLCRLLRFLDVRSGGMGGCVRA